jgi:SAM-dependent methyltransferase
VPQGYVVDTSYADTFFKELSPAWLNYVATLNGSTPRRVDGRFTYLELGSGLGTSTVVNAAAFPHGEFHACDFNPAHVEAGQAHAASLGLTNVTFHGDSFGRLLTRDLPQFDFIVAHGVYSWVDADARAALRRVVQRLLVSGGIAYVSYNALPGWIHELPLRKLLVELTAGGSGTSAEQGESAAAALQALRAAGLKYFTANPAATAAVDAYARGDGRYLAHEFMNAAWEPFYGVDVADELAAIGLRRIGSATLADNHLPLVLDENAAGAIAKLTTARQRELAVDFASNQRFRRDVFVRGEVDGGDYLPDQPIGCPREIDTIGLTARVPRGEIRLQEAFIRDLRTLMSEGSWTFGDAVAALASRSGDVDGITRNLVFLIAAGVLAPFARVHRPPGATSRIAGTIVERALSLIVREERSRIVPSDVYGNGVELDVESARRLLAAEPFLPESVFARLGLVAS